MSIEIALLLSSAGRRVGLVECFRRDAELLGLNLRLIASDMKPDLSAACAVSDASFASPPCNHPEYETFVLELCRREGVKVVVPTIDTELAALASLSGRLREGGTHAVVSSHEIVALARDKWRTAEQLSHSGIRTPRTSLRRDFNPKDTSWTWPIIVKPIAGSSSIGVQTVSRSEFRLDALSTDCIIQERLIGEEYTVNMFFDQNGIMKCAIPHLRIETRAGEVSKGETARHAELEDMARHLGNALPGARGPLCFQAIVDAKGIPTLFEINARFGGGFPLAYNAGASFTRWLLEEAAGRDSSANNNWRPGVQMLRYDAAIFR